MAPKKRRSKVDQVRLRKVLQEAARRQEDPEAEHYRLAAESLLEGLTVEQRAFVQDPEEQKAALCTRRAGKTWASKIAILYTALTQPHSVSVYVNSSRRECLQIIWNGQFGIISLLKRYGIKYETNKTQLTIELSNGARILLLGVDDSNEMEKLRGQSYDFIVIDESAKFTELQYFCTDIIFPALMDRDGTLALIGTPASACAGFFFEVTKDKQDKKNKGWSVHRWTYKENTKIANLEVKALRQKKRNGWGDDHPTWLREYCGKWIYSAELIVYAFNGIPEEERYYDELPCFVDNTGTQQAFAWEYILGVDLGFRDPFAYSIWAYTTNHPVAYEIESFKQPELNTDDQADIVANLCKRFDFSSIVIDGDPATIEAWKVRRAIPAVRAEKQHKLSYIQQWNSAMLTSKVKFKRGSTLSTEMASLQWKEKSLNTAKPVEDKKNTPNDVCDAALYAWKELINWAWEPMQDSPLYGSAAHLEQEEEDEFEWALQQSEPRTPDNYYEMFNQLNRE